MASYVQSQAQVAAEQMDSYEQQTGPQPIDHHIIDKLNRHQRRAQKVKARKALRQLNRSRRWN